MLVIWSLCMSAATGQTLTIQNDIQRLTTLTNTVATLTGKAELHLTGEGDPMTGSTIRLNSDDAWLFLENVAPSAVTASMLGRVRVNNVIAAINTNVRVVQYARGTVIIPQGLNFQPLIISTGRHFTGASKPCGSYLKYGQDQLGSFGDNIRSFTLKRGYMVTFAENENGTGFSKNYVAQDSDLEVAILPDGLDRKISFIRVFPWRWVTKKGTCDVSPDALDASWHYNWNISLNSALNWEYVAIKQQPYWPGTDQDWQARGVNHISHFNEPDNPVEDAYKNLTPQGSSSDAATRLPELLATGLRIGAPAITDGGFNWLANYMAQASAAGYRVDYVPVHYYRSYWDKNDAAGAANQMYNFLKGIHDLTQLPIWVTEFNNGANWTDNAHDPDTTQNRNVIEAMVNMMDTTPWIERYAVYSNVEWFRKTHYDDGALTPMGTMYRDHVSPLAHLQVTPDSGSSAAMDLLFEGNTRDTSGSGNNPLVYGTPVLIPGKQGQALSFDGSDDYLALPPRVGDSTDFTFTGWVRWDGGGDWQRIFDLGDGTQRNFFLCPKSGANTLRFVIKNGGAEQQLNSTPLTIGVWTHLAVTISGDTGKLFVNGSLVDTNAAMTINPADIGTRTNYLGKSQWPDPLFDGAIDSARFFTTALSDTQIAAAASTAILQFASDPLIVDDASPMLQYTGSLAGSATAGDGGRTFTKISGPAWLAVASDGSLTGVPTGSDIGENVFLVRVADASGLVDAANLKIDVRPAPGLVAYYKFHTNTSSTVGDVGGIPYGNPNYVAGKFGAAINLDGMNEFVSLPYGIANSDELTIGVWVNWDGGSAWQRILDFGNGTSDNFFLTPRAGGSEGLRFSMNRGGVSENLETGQLAVGQWVHIAVTLDGVMGRLFVNGTQVDVGPISIRPSDIGPVLNYIGKSQWPDPYFDGRIDELAIFNRALSSAEISELLATSSPVFTLGSLATSSATPDKIFDVSIASRTSAADPVFTKVAGPEWLSVDANGRLSGIPAGSDAGRNEFVIRVTGAGVSATEATMIIVVSPPDGLISHYEFESNASDSSGSNSGVVAGNPLYQDGIWGEAIDLDGADDFVTLPSGFIDGIADVTFATRVCWDGGNSWQRIFDFGNSTTQYMVLTPSSGSGTLRFTISLNGNSAGAEQRLETAALPIGEWTHVAVTLIGNTGTLYVNGVSAATGPITIDPSTLAPTKNYLGKSQFPDPLFNGYIDDFRIYDRGLTASEVRALAVPNAAAIVPPGTYEAWTNGFDFLPGMSAADLDPDGDGLTNLIEYLFLFDPLNSSTSEMPEPQMIRGTSLVGGTQPEKSYLSLVARIRKDRPGISLNPEAGADLDSLLSGNVVQSGPPVSDGDYEIFTWYYTVPVDDAPRGFIRLSVLQD